MSRDAAPVGVIGAGSWGTALAIQLARSGTPVRLWGRNTAALHEMGKARRNARYLPDADFPPSLDVQPELDTLLADCPRILVATPSSALREIFRRVAGEADIRQLVWATKGFDHSTGQLPHEVAADELPAELPLGVLSGPTFAAEVGRGLPTAITLATSDATLAKDFAERLHGPAFRVYTSDDLAGVEVGGAVKNVIAIAAGLSDGLGFGANARAALITRGLAEIVRLGLALGGRAETFMGLAGMGDLVLTCTDDQSRNRRTGLMLADGLALETIRERIGQVVEGADAARAVWGVARERGIDMPITEHVYRVIHAGLEPRAAVESLMARERKDETA